jgi:hypothetical protein
MFLGEAMDLITSLMFMSLTLVGKKKKEKLKKPLSLYEYAETLVWTMPNIKGDKPPKRRAHSACYWNDRVIIIGGGDGVLALDDVYMLNVSDPNQLEWELLEIANSPPIARGYHTCTIVKDKIVLIGGSDGHDCFSDIYILDLGNEKLCNLCKIQKPYLFCNDNSNKEMDPGRY